MVDSPNPAPLQICEVTSASSASEATFAKWLKGGLRRDGVHEFYAPQAGGAVAAAALALLLGMQACAGARPLMWLRVKRGKSRASPYGPGLAELGVDPGTVLLMELPDLDALLIAGLESIRHGGFGAIMFELHGSAPKLGLTASRRLKLAAARSKVMVLIVRSGTEPMASAAHSRWEVAAAPSGPLAANSPGHPAFDLKLLRQRGGPDGLHVQLEWNREQATFRTSLSGSAPAVPPRGTEDRRRDFAA